MPDSARLKGVISVGTLAQNLLFAVREAPEKKRGFTSKVTFNRRKMMTLIRPELRLSGNFDKWLQDSFWNGNPFRGFWGFDRSGSGWGSASRAYLAADLYEDSDAFIALMELPGVCRKDVNVELANSVLQISGNCCENRGDAESSYQFSRALAVPDGVERSRISAELKDGLLQVTMPKMEHRKPLAIEIK